MTEKIKIGVVGCDGRMGQAVLDAVLGSEKTVLSGAVTQKTSPFMGKKLSELLKNTHYSVPDMCIIDDTEQLFQTSDCVIDFTLPVATEKHLDFAVKHGTALVIGTTGFSQEQMQKIQDSAKIIPIMQSGNMSLGVNLLAALAKKVASVLDDDFDVEILEMHHKHKVDAPSGTALLLGNAVAEGRGVALKDVLDDVRSGHTGARKKGDIGMAVLRGGSVVGEHNVIFINDSERIELKHTANDRTIFAKGAVKAATWLHQKSPKLYTMLDVLGL
jgi:4-hydroxy-tetrahydrodipicolinate reductase